MGFFSFIRPDGVVCHTFRLFDSVLRFFTKTEQREGMQFNKKHAKIPIWRNISITLIIRPIIEIARYRQLETMVC